MKLKIKNIGVLAIIAICFCWLSGCSTGTYNTGDRNISGQIKQQPRSGNMDIRSRDNARDIPEYRQEADRAGDGVDNNWNSNDGYDYSNYILSEGDVLALYTNGNTKYGSYFVYQGRSDAIKREKIIQIAFWSIATGILGIITGMAIALKNNNKLKQLIKQADLNKDGKIDVNDLKSIIK